ncbi:DsrE family protein [Sphingobium sp.]|uniref:DsrE family protein n=1 Tax=Sphingobium sp. TaxID=1912891 RepID=UPI00260D8545|nr:DsrE family protein [Sphingobium sp.]
MRPLTIVVTAADAERLRGALVLAAAQAALGGRATLFLQLDAVALLRAPIVAPQDMAHQAAGLPSLATLIAEALALDVAIIACQSGMALAGMTTDDLPHGVQSGGPIGLLEQLDDAARLVLV